MAEPLTERQQVLLKAVADLYDGGFTEMAKERYRISRERLSLAANGHDVGTKVHELVGRIIAEHIDELPTMDEVKGLERMSQLVQITRIIKLTTDMPIDKCEMLAHTLADEFRAPLHRQLEAGSEG